MRRALSVLCLLFTACAPTPGPDAGPRPLRVVVSIPPQAYFLERIAGDRAEITVLLPTGSSPEIAAPSPREMVALADADLVVLVGHPNFVFEIRHVLPVLERHPEVPTVSMAAELDLGGEALGEAGHDPVGSHGHHDHEGMSDPHVWVSPPLVRDAVRAIAGTLMRIDPEGAPFYRRRAEAFVAEIDRLDGEIRHQLDGLEGTPFLVYHPAWSHFAEEYGLVQMAIETEGKEPSPRHLVELIGRARRQGVGVIFAQHGLPSRGAEVVAAEIGARVVILDPLDRDWPGTLRRLTAAIEGAAHTASE